MVGEELAARAAVEHVLRAAARQLRVARSHRVAVAQRAEEVGCGLLR